MKVCDYIWDYLASIGVRHVFGLPGGGAMHLFNALHGREDIKFIGLLHEQAAAFAAEAYSQFEGLGVCLVTSGPGGTNAITGVAAAWTNSRPVLFISGQVQRCDLADNEQRFNGAQEIDIISIVAPITAAVYQLHSGSKIKDVLDSLINIAQGERQAPVWLDIPLDVQCEELCAK